MEGSKLVLALIVVISTAFTPAYAKPSDAPAFGVWLAQWARNARHLADERLPCLRSAKGACGGAFSSPVAGAAKRKGAVDPFSRPQRAASTVRRKVVYKNARRVDAAQRAGGALQNLSAFAQSGRFLVLNDRGSNLLGIDLDAPTEVTPAQVETLSDFVADFEPPPPAE